MYPEIKTLTDFLTRAHHATYANVSSLKVTALRPGSKDYEFTEGDLQYHDTYFGGKKFIGAEVVYFKEKPVWGMNYYGRGLLAEMPESYFDAVLRPALMETPWEKLPVRGPEHFTGGDFTYTMSFVTEGNIELFSACEKIFLKEDLIFENFVHGGWIE